MTTARVHDEASVLELDRQSDAHDIVTTTILSWNMRNHLLIAYLSSRVALQEINAVDPELDIILGSQDDMYFVNIRKFIIDRPSICQLHVLLSFPTWIVVPIVGHP